MSIIADGAAERLAARSLAIAGETGHPSADARSRLDPDARAGTVVRPLRVRRAHALIASAAPGEAAVLR